MRLGLVYHVPYSRGAGGAILEEEGALSRYVESLAPYFSEIALCVPVRDAGPAGGYRLTAPNVTLAALPYFEGPKQLYPRLPAALRRLWRFTGEWDAVHLRVPTPLGIFAYLFARLQRKPVFLLVVGDLREAARSLGYRGWKALAYGAWVAFEERALAWMAARALTFANGGSLYRKHWRPGRPVYETKTSTIGDADIGVRQDTCQARPVRLLCVARVDPRKGLAALPAMLRRLVDRGDDVECDIVGPLLGSAGEREREAVAACAASLGVADRLRFLGPIALGRLFDLYRRYDAFVLPTLPGEGVPRVLLEAMAAGLPVVTTNVAGIPSLITAGWNGLLVPPSAPEELADAVHLLLDDPELRKRLIKHGYETARAHTVEHQARAMMERLAGETGLALRGLA